MAVASTQIGPFVFSAFLFGAIFFTGRPTRGRCAA